MQARLRLKLGKKLLAENVTLLEQYEHFEVEISDVKLLLEKPGFDLGGSKELDVILQMTPSGTIDAKFSVVNPSTPEERRKLIEEQEDEDAEARKEQRQKEAEEQDLRSKKAEAEGFKLFEKEQETRRKEGKPPLEYGQLGEDSGDPKHKKAFSEAAKTSFKGGSWEDYDKFLADSRKRLKLEEPEKEKEKAESDRQSAAERIKNKLKK